MKKIKLQQVFYGVLIVALLGGIIWIYIFANKSNIARISSLKSKAKRDYKTQQFTKAAIAYQELVDSMKVTEEAVRVNYANAGFLSFLLANSKGGKARVNEQLKGVDSLELKKEMQLVSGFATTSATEFAALRSANDKNIASIANNQSGIALMKKNPSADMTDPAKADSLLKEAILLFKEALKKNPANDSARYNYELVKMKLNFPQLTFTKAEQLVAQRRYREAYELIDKAMKKDERMKKYEEYKNKVYSVYKIDSLKKL